MFLPGGQQILERNLPALQARQPELRRTRAHLRHLRFFAEEHASSLLERTRLSRGPVVQSWLFVIRRAPRLRVM